MIREVLAILGAPNSPSGELSDISKTRLDCCRNLFVKGKLVLCTGGWGPHFNTSASSHASYAKAYLIGKGLAEEDFLDLALSTNTVDDAVKMKDILSKLQSVHLTVITSDYHLDRVKLIFNEILSMYDITFMAAKCALDSAQHSFLVQHEKEAIEAILRNGLYY